MVGYQGDVRFENKGSGGLGKMFKQAMTGEGVDMMQCTGNGELFVADLASEIQVMYLENDMISVNGANVLAFSSSIEWDIHRVQARGAAMTGGLYNVSLRGTGYVAVTTKGDPVALDVASAPTFADAQAVVLWTAGVSMDIRVDTGGLKSLVRGGTGELLQMAFGGQGYVLVQPSESVVRAAPSSSRRAAGAASAAFSADRQPEYGATRPAPTYARSRDPARRPDRPRRRRRRRWTPRERLRGAHRRRDEHRLRDPGLPGPGLGQPLPDDLPGVRVGAGGPAALLGALLPRLVADAPGGAERRAPGACPARCRRPCSAVITQNVDGLHERAGTEPVVALHGRIADVSCLGCGDRMSREALQREMEQLNPGWLARHATAAGASRR